VPYVHTTRLRRKPHLVSAVLAALTMATAPVTLDNAVSAPLTARSAVAAGERLSYIAFLNPSLGYGYFVHQGAVRCEAEVAPTDDGGAVFGPLAKVTSWDCADTPSVHYLAVDDDGDGFLYGPDLYVTHDGGRKWASGDVSGRVVSVQAVGESIWVVTARCANPAMRACRLALFESRNGAPTWAPEPVPVARANPYVGEAGQSWLARTSLSSAYLISNPGGIAGSNDDRAPMWSTTNSGATWSERSVPVPLPRHSSVMSIPISATPYGAMETEM
jgi:hypothetical protein